MYQTLHRISFGLLVFLTLLCPLLSFAAALTSKQAGSTGGPGDKRQYVSQKYFLILDTIKSGYLWNADGGVVSADAIPEPGGPSYYSKKHPGSIIYEPLILQPVFPLAQSVSQWISDSWSGKSTSHNGDVFYLDYTLTNKEQTKFTNALLTETTIPECGGSNKDTGYISMTIAPGTALPVTPESVEAWIKAYNVGSVKTWISNNFKLTIDGLDCTKVSKIDSFTVKQTGSSKVEFPNLKITLAYVTSQSWRDWHKDFIINGSNGESKEKNGTLILYGKSLTDEYARIEFYNLGILNVRASTTKGSDQIKRITAELYCERMVFKGPGYTATHDTGSKSDPAKEETQDSQDAKEATDDCQLGQTYIIGKENPLHLTVNSLEYIASRVKTGTRYTRPEVGEKLLVVHYTLQNPGRSDLRVGRTSIDWMATDSNGVSREQGFVGVEETGNALDQPLPSEHPVKCYAVIPMPAIGKATKLTAPSHAESVNVARYNLRDKVTALPAPFADPKDPTGSTPLDIIPGKVGVTYPVGDYDMTVESVAFSDKPISDLEMPENSTYTMVSIKYTNFAEGAFEVVANEIELRDVDGQSYSSRAIISANALRPITLKPEPGETVKFRLIFPTPKNTGLQSLILKSGPGYSVAVDMSSYKTP